MQQQVYSVPKAGNQSEEYEDAAAGDGERGRFAIADGASESYRCREWARLLVDGFVQDPGKLLGPWDGWLPRLQAQWSQQANGVELPWYAETKVQLGASATFLGLVIGLENDWRSHWQAVAVGDCCLFQIRKGRPVLVFPMTDADEFDQSPELVSSLQGSAGRVCASELRVAGRWVPKDRFWLTTDALGQWLLRQLQKGVQPWVHVERMLAQSNKPEAFGLWIDELRKQRDIRNDDTTLMIITV